MQIVIINFDWIVEQFMQDDILTIEEVASYLRVSDRTVYDWAQKGEIPAGTSLSPNSVKTCRQAPQGPTG